MRGVLVCLVVLGSLALASPASALDPNDPAWYAQWAHRVMRLQQAWDVTTGDPNVIIATVDTGVRATATDLQGALVQGWDFTVGSPSQDDTHGHGSYVASQIVARGNNGTGMAGFCWRCRLMPIRVTRDAWAGSESIAAGIRYAVDHGARIVSVSFNHEGWDFSEAMAVEYARQRNVLVVASAGNNPNEIVTYPAGYPGVLSVTATDQFDRVEPWATRGGWVTLAAPGCQIVVAPRREDRPEDVWGELCGTSVTAPAVAGVAALLFSARPSLTADQVAAAMRSSAVPVAGIGGGRLDAYAALVWLGLAAPAAPPAGTVPTGPAGGGGGTVAGGGATPSGSPVTQPVTTATGGQATQPTRTRATRFSRQVRIDIGTVRAMKRLFLEVGAGRLTLTFTSRFARECTLTFYTASGILISMPHRATAISLSTAVPQGRYTVEISCQSRRVKKYMLGIAGALPAGR